MRVTSVSAIALVCASAFPLASAQGNVIVVANGGYYDLQNAISAAVDGDTIIVRGGTYSACTIVGKEISIIADPEQSATLGGIQVNTLPAGRVLVLAGLHVMGVTVDHCAGSVRLIGIDTSDPGNYSAPALSINASNDVAAVRCTLHGGGQDYFDPPPPNGPGVLCRNGRVALYDCDVAGGHGRDGYFNGTYIPPALPGPAGVDIDVSSVFLASHCTIRGGSGGHGSNLACVHLPCGIAPSNGANGGVGLSVPIGGSAFVLDTLVLGGLEGPGGTGGQCCPQTTWGPGSPGQPGSPSTGHETILSGASLELVAPSVVREQQSLALTIHGTPGSNIYLASSRQTQWLLDTSVFGTWLVGPGLRRIHAGTIDASGSLSLSLPIPALPPGMLASETYLQVVLREPTGQIRLGSPCWLTILNAGL